MLGHNHTNRVTDAHGWLQILRATQDAALAQVDDGALHPRIADLCVKDVLRSWLKDAFQHQCQLCGALGTQWGVNGRGKWQIDRITPGCRGGIYEINNVTLACRKCNVSDKAAKDFVGPVRSLADMEALHGL